jgi:hypothetical protein
MSAKWKRSRFFDSDLGLRQIRSGFLDCEIS